jgi:hypothetical protein
MPWLRPQASASARFFVQLGLRLYNFNRSRLLALEDIFANLSPRISSWLLALSAWQAFTVTVTQVAHRDSALFILYSYTSLLYRINFASFSLYVAIHLFTGYFPMYCIAALF